MTEHLQAKKWFTIEPNNRYDFVGDSQNNPNKYSDASVFVGIGGDLSLVSKDGTTKVFKNIPNGTFIPCVCVRVNQIGTTAQEIIGLVGSN